MPIVKRKFLPYSEWIYFKIYSGPRLCERVLVDTIYPFIENGLHSGLFDHFFFIRYYDEFHHLRIRFYNNEKEKQLKLTSLFFSQINPLFENGIIDKVAIDTYCREIERYNEELIECAEQLFFNDSMAILKFLRLMREKESERERILFALKGIDMLLEDFNFSVTEKISLLKGMSLNYFNEFGGQGFLKSKLNNKYRMYQKDIFCRMGMNNGANEGFKAGCEILEQRSQKNADIANKIMLKLEKNGSKESLTKYLPSYIHMFMNRLFISNQRKYELVLYHFLLKYYSSMQAIAKKRIAL